MLFDPHEGLYIFEVTLGFKVDGARQYSTPYLVQADDPEEAEEKVFEYIDDLDIEHEFWIEELSAPYGIEEYTEHMEESEAKSYPLLGELSEEEFKDFFAF